MKYIKGRESFKAIKHKDHNIRKEKNNMVMHYEIVGNRSWQPKGLDTIIINGSVRKEVLTLCKEYKLDLIPKLFNFYVKNPKIKLDLMTRVYQDVIISPVKLYDINTKLIKLPDSMAETHPENDGLNDRAYITNFDSKASFFNGNWGAERETIHKFMSESYDVRETIDKINSMSNLEKFTLHLEIISELILGRTEYTNFNKNIKILSNKRIMKNYDTLSIDGFDFFGDDD